MVEQLSKETLAKEQKEDPILSKVREWVQKQEKPSKEELKGHDQDLKVYSQIFETLELKDDILYSTVRSNVCSGEKTRRIAIPYRLRDTTFYWAHKHVCAGHFGHAATTLRAQTRFYYPGMHNDIKGRVNSCQTCLAKQTKTDIKKEHTNLGNLVTLGNAFQLI